MCARAWAYMKRHEQANKHDGFFLFTVDFTNLSNLRLLPVRIY